MFKIDKPENFDVTLRVRRRQGQSNETQIQCPCQDKSVRIKLCNLPDHLKPSKKDRQTGHAKWMETLKISIQSIEQVARLVESNEFWKYKMGFQTKLLDVLPNRYMHERSLCDDHHHHTQK